MKKVLFCLFLCVLVFVFHSRKDTVPFRSQEYYEVTHVIDGDTFKVRVNKKEYTIRMLGINTPETLDPRKAVECYGKEASDENKKMLTGSKVRLEFSPKREVKDKYNRFLAYVYDSHNILVNEYLLRNGFAREYTYGSQYSLRKLFKDIEKVAKKNKVGMWNYCEKAK